ncbi:two-component regulator propeller domain-containing protein [uncultured Bacteroides sp.]|uniref:hybrid sensor histidine kinase/response regulator transcription factor n=1 Tax=uncultured Bacteroides sp. TaxID=162156 RepID=UPI002AA628B5|nr:two-component regulator propeller domain-containing protein [uncultured Bacteroides sp.]
MKTLSLYVFTYFLLVCVPSANAQDNYMFKRLEAKDGLSHSQVNYIFKDSRGFMWFATAGGLNRFDGYNYKVYRHQEKEPWSLPDNYVDNIQEDSEGNLWIHRGTGYVIYDVRKEIFVQDMVAVVKKYGLDEVPAVVHVDKRKNLWFYVPGLGGFQYQAVNKRLIAYPQKGKQGLSAGMVTDIHECKAGALYLFNNGLLECVDRNTGKVIKREDYIPRHTPGFRSDKYALFVDAENDYWVYSKGASGVWTFHPQQGQWAFFDNNVNSVPYRLSSNVVQAIAEDVHGRIWLGTDHGGIDIIDKKNKKLINLQNDISDERSLSHNSINCIYCDDMNLIWVGTYKKGISYYSESIFKFGVEHLSYFKQIKNFDSDITFLAEGDNGNLWVGTNGSGLICMNRLTGKKQLYEHNPGVASSLSNDVIVSLCAATDGKLWIGTYLGGMDCFDGKRFVHYQHNPGDSNSLASNNVWSIVEDKKGLLWIGTLGAGVQSFNPATGVFVTYSGSRYLSSDYVSSLYMGKNDVLYIGTAVGITLYHEDTGRFEQLTGNRAGTQRFSSMNVNQVYEDSRGLLWVGTRDGLNVFDQKKDRVLAMRKTDGLADDIICGIIEDNNKNMWVTTVNGVSNVLVNADPKTGNYSFSYSNYDELDGLQGKEFNIRSMAKTSGGEILMGGVSGFNFFDPNAIKYNKILPKVVFTGLTLFNEEVKIDSVYRGNRILTEALSRTKKITLEYRQNVFSISFSGMNYILPEKVKYAYMLEGFNSDWLVVEGNTHRVTYTNLAPGTYTFKVKAANSDGYWNEEAAMLTIVIRPPFWLSLWAYIVYVVLLIGALAFARLLVLRSERNKFRLKQVELEAERKHELDDMKLRFFTNISHEFRTPLTLILAPMDGLIKSIENEDYRQKLVLMKRNAVRLLNLVNELLDFRRSDVKGNQLNLSKEDIISCLKMTCQSFAELSDKKNIHLTFSTSVEKLTMEFDEEKLNKIMMNLLSNAFKFTDAEGKVDVTVGLLPANDDRSASLEVKVADTGLGIKDEDKERVFERFYQVQHGDAHDFGGSGIGLHLVKEFVLLHHGDVYVCDNREKGSVFVFILPLTYTLSEQEVEMIAASKESKETIMEGDEGSSAELEEISRTGERKEIPLILLVDDNNDFRSFMKESLKGQYRIREVENGKIAWRKIAELQPDLIISDVMMPEMDGYELCSLVKNDVRTSHIPLILLTARTAEAHKLEGLETGADDYITKPFNFDILSLRIKKLLEIREMRREKFSRQIDPEPSEITITPLDEKLIRKAILYVENNISRSELSVEELSRELGMSRVHLYKKLMHITGKSPVEFIRVLRLKRAAQLLRESQLNVSEIAYEVGFNNPKYFSKYFREEFGMLPSAYMVEMKKEPDGSMKNGSLT